MVIDLNFMSLETSEFSIQVFRSKFNSEPKQDGYFVGRLPTDRTEECDPEYASYRVGLSSYDGATPYIFHANENPQLMIAIMWFHLKHWAEHLVKERIIEAEIIDRYEKFISFIVEDFPEGQRVVKVYPYYLSEKKQYGVLLEFAFRKRDDVPFGRKVQQLSFSLDRAGKSNANSYLDRKIYIQNFIKTKLSAFGALSICGRNYNFSSKLTQLQGQELKSRTYIFKDGHENCDKIKGIKIGPFAVPPKAPLFVFIFKKAERNSGNELFRALAGKGYPSAFSGMKEWFDCDIGKNNVTSITMDFDADGNAVSSLTTRLADIIAKNPDKKVIGLFIDSYSHDNGRSENYTKAKQVFFSAGIPLQVVRNDRIIKSDGLKWAISGIGLQVFSKLGGVP